MCGGCGAPLTHNDAPTNEGATVAIADLPDFADRTPPGLGARYPSGYPLATSASDTQPTPPTPVDLRSSAFLQAMPATPITPMRHTAPPLAPPAVGVATTPQAQRRGGFWWRAALILLLALVVLGGLGYGGWGLFAQPSIHSSVDTELRAHFVTFVNAAFRTTSGQHTLTDAQANNALGPTDSSEWAQNLVAQFGQGVVYLNYSFVGTTGDISTRLYVASGRLKAAATNVDGYLAGVETGIQAEAAINAALDQIPASEIIEQVNVTSGSLTFTIM